jgi:hypothetical protein
MKIKIPALRLDCEESVLAKNRVVASRELVAREDEMYLSC